jgi:ATP-dependent helicase/nuclease subunit B
LLDGENISDEWKTVLNYYSQNEKDKFERILEGLEYTNKAENISKENIEKLYGKRLRASISRLEQYRRCPFSFHMKYGLKLKEKEELKLQSIDTGTFMHEVIDEFFAVLEERNLDVKKLDDNLVREIVEEIIENILEMSKYYIFSSTAKFKALTRKLKKVVFESIEYIVYTLKNSTFNILGHEIEFSDNGKYKPIIIELDSGKRVELVGKIDRLDIGKLDDKTYVRIIDYKSSIKNIDMNQVEAGLQIQLITYLDAITKQESFSPSGILYLGLTDNKVTNKRNLTEEEIKQEIRKKFRMNGIVLADVNIIKMMDTNINGASDIIPVTLKQDGNISESKSSTIDENEFEDLQKSVTNTIKQISTEILSGNIDIKPYNYKTQTGCDYCEYKSICMFNPNLKENTYNYIKKK